uniref:Uncharacterized protein n=1 Tax=Lactuca sativa TaxID=4236 RepID=A0A9R1XI76_LACSA|nr:hypothetical protein LSAT_V11C400204150 [Lactuca sativa]
MDEIDIARRYDHLAIWILGSHQDVHHLGTYVGNHKLIDVYIELGKQIYIYILCPPILVNLELMNDSIPDQTRVENVSHLDKEPLVVDHDNCTYNVDLEMNLDNEELEDNNRNDHEFDDDIDSQYSNFLIDEENLIDDVDVDIKDFHINIDKDAEWIGGSSKCNVHEVTQEGDLEVINIKVFLSGLH